MEEDESEQGSLQVKKTKGAKQNMGNTSEWERIM